eukprot:TRINITY_DN113456_c0_g1_i1.p1 TRINITY_DN113456_c0_g1~~TRINITY_DN113456_c0_g1_i1.p1  ORF type:complete len:104 (+),score=18.54 TRINITY_DN113456_c0_g1_i1:35-313(+)
MSANQAIKSMECIDAGQMCARDCQDSYGWNPALSSSPEIVATPELKHTYEEGGEEKIGTYNNLASCYFGCMSSVGCGYNTSGYKTADLSTVG